jgi:hypothetical protein
MLASWNGKTYLKHTKQLYCWEPHWNCFRPIESISWNGTPICTDRDIFSATYGFGSAEKKAECERLTDEFMDKLEEAQPLPSIEALWTWTEYPLSRWVFDRQIVVCSCESPTRTTWKTFLQEHSLRHKTLRSKGMRKNTYTKHRLPK